MGAKLKDTIVLELIFIQNYFQYLLLIGCICGLVVRVPDYRSRGPGSIPGATREVVGLERGPLRLISTIEELLGRKSSGSRLETRDYGRAICCADLNTPHYPLKLPLTSPTGGGRSVSIVHSRTKAMEIS
jgi:hypothetical protein